MTRAKTIKSLIILLLLGSIWGTGYSIARFATINGVPPLGYSFWQSIGPALILSLLLLFWHGGNRLRKQNFHFLYFAFSGLTGIALPNSVMYFSAPHLPAGISAMVVNIVPVIAYPLALMTALEKFDYLRAFGIILACCGLMLIILPKTSLPSSNMVPWVLFSLLTPLSFAIWSVFTAFFRPPELNSLQLSVGMLIASSIMLVPIVFFSESFYLFHFPFTLADWVILLEIILSSIGCILLFQLIRIAGPVYYSLVDTIVVITGIFWGYIIFHEKLNQWTGAAMFLIIAALLIVTHRQRKVLKQ